MLVRALPVSRVGAPVNISQSAYTVRIECSLAEMRVLLNELLDTPGGSRRPKIRQLCNALETHLKLHGSGFEEAGEEAEARLRRKKETA